METSNRDFKSEVSQEVKTLMLRADTLAVRVDEISEIIWKQLNMASSHEVDALKRDTATRQHLLDRQSAFEKQITTDFPQLAA